MGLFESVGGIAGGFIGADAARGDRGDARNKMIEANEIIQKLKDAPVSARPLLLEQYRQAGILTPELEQQITTGPSKVEGITEDVGLRNAQLDALRSLTQRSREGLTAMDRAALNKARQNVQTDLEAKRQQIIQNAQMRGQAGGGSELAAQLLAAQGGANQQSEESDRLMAMAQQNALQSAASMGNLGGQIREQDFGVNKARASAADEMNRFNVQNQISNQQRNVGSKNNAQQLNLNNLQGIQNRNVGMNNQELQRQRQGELTDWENANNLATMKSNSLRGQSNYLQKSGDRAAQNAVNIGAGIGGMADSAVGMFGGGGGSSDEEPMYTGPEDESGFRPIFYKGGKVPGHSQVPGDSPKNDTVNAMVSPGEIIVPKSLADSKLGKELVKLINAHNSVKHKLNSQD